MTVGVTANITAPVTPLFCKNILLFIDFIVCPLRTNKKAVRAIPFSGTGSRLTGQVTTEPHGGSASREFANFLLVKYTYNACKTIT